MQEKFRVLYMQGQRPRVLRVGFLRDLGQSQSRHGAGLVIGRWEDMGEAIEVRGLSQRDWTGRYKGV